MNPCIKTPDPENIPSKLRMAPRETASELAHRVEREQRALDLQREDRLENQSLAPFRVGSVPYLNAAPLVRGLESQILADIPSQLAQKLQRGELDAALVSLTEVLFNDSYDILDGIAIASLGEVQSVLVAHRGPLENASEIFCDPASLSSVNLMRVLLAEQGLKPEIKTLRNDNATLPDYLLLIGDRAIEFALAPHEHRIWDLGAAWFELTRLPFVYAVWALRRGAYSDNLCRQLRDARDFGLDTLDSIIDSGTQFTHEFRKDYLSWHIHYHLGTDEKRGIARFIELLRKHNLGPVFEPRFVA
jgi:predicted solute-binding protein